MYKWTALGLCACFVATMAACNNTVDMKNQPIPVVDVAPDAPLDEKTNSVAVVDIDAKSPATVTNPIPTADASPAKVCESFVRFLNAGDLPNAELLLTPTALTATSRAGFQIPPIGEADSVCTFSEPQYGTKKQRLCYVDCQIGDDESKITWMLRKSIRGWRVAGMMIDDDETESVNLISFENPRDIQQIKTELADEPNS